MATYTEVVQKDSAHLIKEHAGMFQRELRSIARLKEVIRESGMNCAAVKRVGDIAGGLGQHAYHLRDVFPNASFEVIDILPEQIEEAKRLHKEMGIADRFSANVGDIYHLPAAQYDVTLCWNTIFVLDDEQEAVRQLVHATKPGGHVFFSLLLNTHDVDLKTTIIDYTRASSKDNAHMSYNTYAQERFIAFCRSLGVKEASAHEFVMDIDLENRFQGVGTYTLKLEDGKRLQVSGGLLMRWAIVHLVVA